MNEVASQLACLFVHLSLNISKRARTVDLGLAKAETVQIGPLKDNDLQSDTLLSRSEGQVRHRIDHESLPCLSVPTRWSDRLVIRRQLVSLLPVYRPP